jgi:NADPH2:quinone reductase
MKALLSKTAGGPETLVLEDVADPVPGAGEVRIAVKACAVNFPDVLVIQDLYQFKPERPFAPGSEIAGVIDMVGEGVTKWKVGDRILSPTASSGGMAELKIVDQNAPFALPDERSFAEGASLLLTYGTTIHALLDRGDAKAGETMLVLGAAGGVGVSAIEIGKALGMRVVAAVSSQDKADFCKSVGADDAVVYPHGPLDRDQQKALSAAFKSAVGAEGADVVYDIIGGDYADPAIRSIAWEGRYLVIGFTAGIPKLPLNLTLLKACDVRGVFWGAAVARDPAGHARNVAKLFDLWREGKINPRVTETFPLARGGEAIAKLASRTALGKIVVTID